MFVILVGMPGGVNWDGRGESYCKMNQQSISLSEMKLEKREIPREPSWILSAAAWIFVAVGTTLLSLIGLFIFWPLSLIFQQASGELPHRLSQFWARVICVCLPFWKVRVEGLDKIDKRKTYVVVSNHQSLLDILVSLAGLPIHFKFIAKRQLFWIPFLGWHLWFARYIPLKRGDPESGRACLEKARYWVRRGASVVFFPEGTRSPDGEIHPFKAGAFKLAWEEKVDLLPVVILGTHEAMPKKSWRIEKRAEFLLSIQNAVSTKDRSPDSLEALREGVRLTMIEELRRLRS